MKIGNANEAFACLLATSCCEGRDGRERALIGVVSWRSVEEWACVDMGKAYAAV